MTAEEDPYLWTGYHDENGELVITWKMTLSENLRLSERLRREQEERFRRAPFPLYGLPPTWEGTRRLGGESYSKDRFRRATIHSLSLVHGSNVEGQGPSLDVETSIPDAVAGGSELRCVAESRSMFYHRVRPGSDEPAWKRSC